MGEKGPTWWKTCEIGTSQSCEQNTAKYFALFEFFHRNAQKYALLRVSLTDGIKAYEAAFSPDQIFLRPFPSCKSISDTSALFINVLDETVHGSFMVHLNNATSTSSDTVTLIISSPLFHSDITLCIDNNISSATFTSRIMEYLNYVEAERQAENQTFQHLCTSRDDLLKKLNHNVSVKLQEDQQMLSAARYLLHERKKRACKKNTTSI